MVVIMMSGLVEYDIFQHSRCSLLLPFSFTSSSLKIDAAASSKRLQNHMAPHFQDTIGLESLFFQAVTAKSSLSCEYHWQLGKYITCVGRQMCSSWGRVFCF